MPAEPDLLIGLDIGVTFVKVAYYDVTKRAYHKVPSPIQMWPNGGDQAALPTLMAYRPDGTFLAFGFEAKDLVLDKSVCIFRAFKRQFPHGEATSTSRPGLSMPARKLYQDLLYQILGALEAWYNHTKEKRAAEWANLRIEFSFSVPAAGDHDGAAKALVEAATRAGFASCPGHSIHKVVLTEAEASAKYHMLAIHSDQLKKEVSTMLILDSGGMTTDLCVFVINKKDRSKVFVATSKPVSGASLGSTDVDADFAKHVAAFLTAGRVPLTGKASPDEVGLTLSWSDEFQQWKHKLAGSPKPTDEKSFVLPELGTKKGNFSATGHAMTIEDGTLRVPTSVLMKIMDNLVKATPGVIPKGEPRTIKDQLSTVIESMFAFDDKAEGPSSVAGKSVRSLDLVVLSGGFGSSKYVERLLNKSLFDFQDKSRSPYPNAAGITLVPSHKPQLCVCYGLIYANLAQIDGAKSQWPWRRTKDQARGRGKAGSGRGPEEDETSEDRGSEDEGAESEESEDEESEEEYVVE